jgi:hypothetical protein
MWRSDIVSVCHHSPELIEMTLKFSYQKREQAKFSYQKCGEVILCLCVTTRQSLLK